MRSNIGSEIQPHPVIGQKIRTHLEYVPVMVVKDMVMVAQPVICDVRQTPYYLTSRLIVTSTCLPQASKLCAAVM